MNAEQLHHLNVNRFRIDSSVYRRSKYEELFFFVSRLVKEKIC